MTARPPASIHTVRVPDHIWAAAAQRAAAEGTSVSAVVVQALLRYGRHEVSAFIERER